MAQHLFSATKTAPAPCRCPAGGSGASTRRDTPGGHAGEEAPEGAAIRRVPLSPAATAALQGALHAALNMGHDYIGTEHIRLGLVEGDDATADTLARLGITAAGAKQQIVAELAAITASQPG